MTTGRQAFVQRRDEFKGLPNWCESCGLVLCCSSCLLNHRPACERVAWAYGLTDGEFEKQFAIREATNG
jgi:hypothetical protein